MLSNLKEILKVYTKTRPNLRDGELFIYVGQLFLSRLFDNQDYDLTDTKEVTLMYPERWLNLLEQRMLFYFVMDRCPNLTSLIIHTHSVYIIQCTPNGCLWITDDSSKYPERKYERGVRYSPPIEEDKGLQVIHVL